MLKNTPKMKCWNLPILTICIFSLITIPWKYSIAIQSISKRHNLPQAPAPPQSPNNLTIQELTQNEVLLTWVDRSNDEDGFNIQFQVDYADWGFLDGVGSNVTTFTHYGASPGHTYCYRVYAHNLVGDSGFTNVACITIESTIPFPPSDLHANPISSTKMYLNWMDNSYNETGFGIEYNINLGIWTPLAIVSTNVTNYTHSGLTPNQTYCYRVYAINGVEHSAYSNTSCANLVQPPTGILERFWKTLK